MKLKRKIGAIVCCLAVMTGMFSVSVLPAKAAMCTHPIYSVGEEFYGISVTADGHYSVYGQCHRCPACGYSYWTELHNVKVGDHGWYQKLYPAGSNINTATGWEYYCDGCGKYKCDL